MIRQGLAFGLALALTICGMAMTCNAADLPRDEFVYAKGTLACVFHSVTGDPTKLADEGALACLHMGPLKIDMALAEMEQRLGPAAEKWEIEGLEYRVYRYPSNADPKGYYAVGYLSGVAKVIQQTGRLDEKSFPFSSINLGDSWQRVRDRLGPPNRTSPFPEFGGTLWNYSPLPFTFVIRDDHVFSIRIRDPRTDSQ
jgi:hypothetical protein